jgi:hypothetical protein
MSTENAKYLHIVNSLSHQNKYCRWYNKLIHVAIKRSSHQKSTAFKKKEYAKLNGYGEAHHILPRSIGNREDVYSRENITVLSFREHYIAHLLLTKMFLCHIHKQKMIYALNIILLKTHTKREIKINSKIYHNQKSAFRKLAEERLKNRQSKQGLTSGLTKYIHIDTKQIRCFSKNNPPSDKWQTFNSGKVVALNLQTAEKILITQEEFKNSTKYRGHTFGKVFAYEPNTQKKVMLSKEEYATGEFDHINTGRKWNHTAQVVANMKDFFTAKNIYGETRRMHKNDPLLLSGEWGGVTASIYKVNKDLVINLACKYGTKLSNKIKAQFRKKPKIYTISFECNDTIYEVTRLS